MTQCCIGRARQDGPGESKARSMPGEPSEGWSAMRQPHDTSEDRSLDIGCSLKMRRASPPVLLAYGIKHKRGLTFGPVGVGVAHFAAAYALYSWWIGRLVVLVFASLHRHPGDALPSFAIADRVGQALLSILLIPIRGIWLHRVGHFAIPPAVCIAMDSVLWGIACWLLILLRQRVGATRGVRD